MAHQFKSSVRSRVNFNKIAHSLLVPNGQTVPNLSVLSFKSQSEWLSNQFSHVFNTGLLLVWCFKIRLVTLVSFPVQLHLVCQIVDVTVRDEGYNEEHEFILWSSLGYGRLLGRFKFSICPPTTPPTPASQPAIDSSRESSGNEMQETCPRLHFVSRRRTTLTRAVGGSESGKSLIQGSSLCCLPAPCLGLQRQSSSPSSLSAGSSAGWPGRVFPRRSGGDPEK